MGSCCSEPPPTCLVSSAALVGLFLGYFSFPRAPRLLVGDPRLCDPPGSMVLPRLCSLWCQRAPACVARQAAGRCPHLRPAAGS